MGCSIAGMLEHRRMLEDAGMLGCAGMQEHAEMPVCGDAPACKDSCTHRALSLQCLEAAVSSRAPPLPPTERNQENTGPGAALSQSGYGGPRNPELRARAGAGRGVQGRERSLCRISARLPFPAPPTIIPGGAGPAGGGAERGGTGSAPRKGRWRFLHGVRRGLGVVRVFLFLVFPNAAHVPPGVLRCCSVVPGAAVLPLCSYCRPGPSHAAMPAEPLVCADTATR